MCYHNISAKGQHNIGMLSLLNRILAFLRSNVCPPLDILLCIPKLFQCKNKKTSLLKTLTFKELSKIPDALDDWESLISNKSRTIFVNMVNSGPWGSFKMNETEIHMTST